MLLIYDLSRFENQLFAWPRQLSSISKLDLPANKNDVRNKACRNPLQIMAATSALKRYCPHHHLETVNTSLAAPDDVGTKRRLHREEGDNGSLPKSELAAMPEQ
jgi:hypothetical protein